MATVTFEVDVVAFEAVAYGFLAALIPAIRAEQWAVAEEFNQRVKIRTPVRTRRLQTSIHGVESSPDSYPYTDDKGRSFEGALSTGPVDDDEVIVGTNVPYAIYVEGGTSSSNYRPTGMFAVTETEIAPDLAVRMNAVPERLWRG